MNRISKLLLTLVLVIALSGCMGTGPNDPDGDARRDRGQDSAGISVGALKPVD